MDVREWKKTDTWTRRGFALRRSAKDKENENGASCRLDGQFLRSAENPVLHGYAEKVGCVVRSTCHVRT